jgi:hypothetical protein
MTQVKHLATVLSNSELLEPKHPSSCGSSEADDELGLSLLNLCPEICFDTSLAFVHRLRWSVLWWPAPDDILESIRHLQFFLSYTTDQLA